MTGARRVEALIVGAGPAGAVTAAALAGRGVPTLLVDDGGGAKSDYDVVLSDPAMRGLASVDALEAIAVRSVDAVEVRLGDQEGRAFIGTGAAVCNRRRLRAGLVDTAVAAGAEYLQARATRLERRADGHRAVIADKDSATTVVARHVVAANGAATPGASHATGIACVQRFTGVALGARIVLTLATPRTNDPRERPTCVWVSPGEDASCCTVGVTRLGEGNREELLDIALAVLGNADPPFAAGSPVGPLVSGTLSSGFTPQRAVRSGRLLVGDAAGLVNPFTGEGLSYAVQSGLLAARSIAAWVNDSDAAGRAYSRRLAATFVGYFETARHAARRYHLAWRVLSATANSDSPIFAKARRAVLLPEGFAGLTAAEPMNLPGRDMVLLWSFLAACDEVAITTVRREWPFIARLLIAGENAPHQRPRPAVPFFAALLSVGRTPDIKRATVGAAIELATLGALAFLGPASPSHRPTRAVDWGTAATALAGDFLLAQASRLVAESAPEISWSFADWLAELTALRAARLDTSQHARAAAVFASLLEFPARIGAQLGGASPEVVRTLREFGSQCGHAFLYADDVLALRGERTRLDTTLEVMLEGRISAIPDLVHVPSVSTDLLASDARLRSAAHAATTAACRDAWQSAHETTRAVPNPTSARILREFVSIVAAPIQASADASGPPTGKLPMRRSNDDARDRKGPL